MPSHNPVQPEIQQQTTQSCRQPDNPVTSFEALDQIDRFLVNLHHRQGIPQIIDQRDVALDEEHFRWMQKLLFRT